MKKIIFRELVIIIIQKVLLVLCIPIAIAIRLLRPFVVIRFAHLCTTRIGHFTINTEVYLCERDAGMHGRRFLDVFYYTYRDSFCNLQLKKMWDRTLTISRFASLVDKSSRLMPGSKKHMIPWRVGGDRDVHNLLVRTPPHLTFIAEEEAQGEVAMRKLGIAKGFPFVCIIARDPVYLDKFYPADSSAQDWRYHNYRDCSIKNFLLAADNLTQRGSYVVRMGSVVKEALKTENPKIINYATNGSRTEFLDIYLGAKCKFFITASAGMAGIPIVFRRPVAFVNQIPLEGVWTSSDNYISIFKKLWLRKERRFMSFQEILDRGAGRFLFSQQYEELGVDIIENTPEEIEGLAIEMDERLDGTWVTKDEDEYLQQKFWSIFPSNNDWHGKVLGRIGADFLRKNKELLGL